MVCECAKVKFLYFSFLVSRTCTAPLDRLKVILQVNYHYHLQYQTYYALRKPKIESIFSVACQFFASLILHHLEVIHVIDFTFI